MSPRDAASKLLWTVPNQCQQVLGRYHSLIQGPWLKLMIITRLGMIISRRPFPNLAVVHSLLHFSSCVSKHCRTWTVCAINLLVADY